MRHCTLQENTSLHSLQLSFTSTLGRMVSVHLLDSGRHHVPTIKWTCERDSWQTYHISGFCRAHIIKQLLPGPLGPRSQVSAARCAWNMILRAYATKIFAQTDDARTGDVRSMSIAVTLSSNRQQKSGTHIGMSMQRPRHHQLKRGTKSHCAHSLDISSPMTTGHADSARKLGPKPPCGATRTRTRGDALTHGK